MFEKIVEKNRDNYIQLLLSLILFSIGIYYSEIYKNEYVNKGFSAFYAADYLLRPENYIYGFASGAELIKNTIVIVPYIIMNYLGVTWGVGIYFMVFSELLAIILLIFYLISDCFCIFNIKNESKLICVFLITIILTISNFRGFNLGMWGMPYFNGQNYNFVDAIRFYVLFKVFTDKNYQLRNVILLLFSCMFIHIVQSLWAISLVGLYYLINKEFKKAISLTLFFGVSSLIFMKALSHNGDLVSGIELYEIAKYKNWHFFPYHRLGASYLLKSLLPCLSIVLLSLYFLYKYFKDSKVFALRFLIIGSFLISFLGLLMTSLSYIPPLIIKIAPIRVTDITLFFSSFIIFITVLFKVDKDPIRITLLTTFLAVILYFKILYLLWIIPVCIIIINLKSHGRVTIFGFVICLSLYFKQGILRNVDFRKNNSTVEVSTWIKNNMNVGELFLATPDRRTGFRALAFKPSYGSLREWSHDGFLYTSDNDIKRLGERRIKVIYGTKLNLKKAKSLVKYYRIMRKESLTTYLNIGEEQLKNLKKDHVKYIIANINQVPKVLEKKSKIVFQNDHYTIFRI